MRLVSRTGYCSSSLRLRDGLVALIATGLAFTALAASAAERVTQVPERPFPGDAIGIPLHEGSGRCLFGPLARAESVRVRQISRQAGSAPEQDSYEHELHYQVGPDEAMCGVPTPRPWPYGHSIVDLGPLPPGQHRVRVFSTRADGQPNVDYEVGPFTVRGDQKPGNDISGAWHSAAHSGQGISVMRQGQLLVAYWVVHDDQGAPSWLMFAGDSREGAAYSGPLYTTRGDLLIDGSLSQTRYQLVGQGRLHYLGCGRARWSWTSEHPEKRAGTQELVQLLLPDGITPCDFRRWERVIPAQWESPPGA